MFLSQRMRDKAPGDTTERWLIHDPIIPLGLLVLEEDTGKSKEGDGVHKYSELPYHITNYELNIRLKTIEQKLDLLLRNMKINT